MWSQTGFDMPDDLPYHVPDLGTYAARCMSQIIGSDLLIYDTLGMSRGGRDTELGFALGLRVAAWIVGPVEHGNLFLMLERPGCRIDRFPGWPAALAELRVQAERSASALAREAGVDPSYWSRLERGERQPPSRGVVLAMARALGLDPEGTDWLLLVAGHRTRLLERVAAVLLNERIPLEHCQGFAGAVELLCRCVEATAS